MDNHFDQAALRAHLKGIEQKLAEVPEETLLQAKRQLEIEVHNAKVDEAKRERKAMKRFLRMQRLKKKV